MFSSYSRDDPSKLMFDQRRQDSCLFMRDTSGISSRLGQAIQTLLEVKREIQGTFLVPTVILGFLSIFKKCLSSSSIESLNTACLSRCQRDVRTPVHMRGETRAFSRVSRGDTHVPSFCDIKDESAFKPLQGNPAFFLGRESRCPFHLRQQIQSPTHIFIAEGSLLFRCLRKVGLPLQSKPGNQLSSRDHIGYTEVSSGCCAEIGVPLD